jgi:hypothetical protein
MYKWMKTLLHSTFVLGVTLSFKDRLRPHLGESEVWIERDPVLGIEHGESTIEWA